MSMTRRDALVALAASGAAVALAPVGTRLLGQADPKSAPAAALPFSAPGTHKDAPLPFNAGKLDGISEKLIVSHHDNNYAGAVKNLNKVELDLAGLAKDAPGYLVAGLRERALTFGNSVTYHELYFANLGGDGKASGTVYKAVANAFGDFGKWEEQFRAVGASLAGGSGWVTLSYDFHKTSPVITWSGGHSNAAVASMPLLVMDMFEHAYHMDFGSAAAKYIDAFFKNINWDEVNRRYEQACAMFAAGKK